MKIPTLSPKLSIGLLLSAALLSTIVAAVLFYSKFHDLPLQKDSGAWSNFGGYFGGVLAPILGLLNLAALVLIALQVTEHQQRSLESKRLAVDLMTEWHAPTLHESRRVISDLISSVRRGERPLPTLWEMEEAEPDFSIHAFRIYHFFERWAVLSEVNEADPKIIQAALRRRAFWFREHFFEPIRTTERNSDMLYTLNYIEKYVFQRLPKLEHE